MLGATQADIKTADLVIVFAGTDESVASEGNDRSSLAMPGNYDSLISQVSAIGNPRTALVIQSDGPVDISGTPERLPGHRVQRLQRREPGHRAGAVLTGEQNPSGHLDFTWYKDDSQLPAIENYGLTPAQTGGLGRTYEYFTGTPTYPFGYGLSYTSFKYSNVHASPSVDANGTVAVTFDVTNTGTTPGATVAQLYVAPQFTVPGTDLPKKQLEGFQKTAVLQPGQTQHITLAVKAARPEPVGRAGPQAGRLRRPLPVPGRPRLGHRGRLPGHGHPRRDHPAGAVRHRPARPGRASSRATRLT